MYPDKTAKKLIASKFQGLRIRYLLCWLFKCNHFHFIPNLFILGDKNYITPVSKGSIPKYFYLLEDTLLPGKRHHLCHNHSSLIKTKNFDGLKGLLYINTNGYAIYRM